MKHATLATLGRWMLAGHIVVGWPKGGHGPVRRRPLENAVNLDRWDAPATDLLAR